MPDNNWKALKIMQLLKNKVHEDKAMHTDNWKRAVKHNMKACTSHKKPKYNTLIFHTNEYLMWVCPTPVMLVAL